MAPEAMSALTRHAAERAIVRLGDLRSDLRLTATRRAVAFAVGHPRGSYAVRVMRDATMHGVPWSESSNGTDVWAIIRDGEVRTMMYRRSSQPATPKALRVMFVEVEV